MKSELLSRRLGSVIEAMKLTRMEEEKSNTLRKGNKSTYTRSNVGSHTSDDKSSHEWDHNRKFQSITYRETPRN